VEAKMGLMTTLKGGIKYINTLVEKSW
jgi:hypothetical protein